MSLSLSLRASIIVVENVPSVDVVRLADSSHDNHSCVGFPLWTVCPLIDLSLFSVRAFLLVSHP